MSVPRSCRKEINVHLHEMLTVLEASNVVSAAEAIAPMYVVRIPMFPLAGRLMSANKSYKKATNALRHEMLTVLEVSSVVSAAKVMGRTSVARTLMSHSFGLLTYADR